MGENFKKKLGDGKCSKCQQPVAKHGAPFYRVRIDMGVINTQALNRRVGLGMFLGSDALADVMGPGQQIVLFTDETSEPKGQPMHEIRLCGDCYTDDLNLAAVIEVANDRAASARDTAHQE